MRVTNSSTNTRMSAVISFTRVFEIVVAEQTGDRDAETGNGRDERGRRAGRDGVDVHIAGRGDGGEGDHDADDRAEQAEERAAGDRDREQHHLRARAAESCA